MNLKGLSIEERDYLAVLQRIAEPAGSACVRLKLDARQLRRTPRVRVAPREGWLVAPGEKSPADGPAELPPDRRTT